MTQVIVTTCAYGADAVLARGQAAYIPIIAQAGAAGVEIRRELLGAESPNWEQIRQAVQAENLFAVYSAPIPIWQENGELNREQMQTAMREAKAFDARWVKFCLGSYEPQRSDVEMLRGLLQEEAIAVTVENDQTPVGGRIERMERFLADCASQEIPIRMTIDLGNWHWTGEDALAAVERLAPYIMYIHCKHVEMRQDKWVTLPLPEEPTALWRTLLERLPQDAPRAIEFPLEGAELEAVSRAYVKQLENA